MGDLMEAIIKILDLKEKCSNLELDENADPDEVMIYVN